MTSQPLEELAWEISGQPVGVGTRLKRVVEVLAHYDKVQILRRVTNLAKGRFTSNATVGAIQDVDAQFVAGEKLQSLARIVLDHRKAHPCHRRCDLENGEFDLLHRRVQLFDGENFDFDAFLNQSHLWRFQFHYHDYLMTQLELGDSVGVSEFLSKWLAVFEPSSIRVADDAWHPYCISRRVITWILLLAAGKDLLNDELQPKLLASLVAQCNHLQKNLERDLGGNHLLENATALAIASQAVEVADASSWSSTALQILKTELNSQVLPSGEHFELSPMYHCHILGNLVRIKAACEGKDAAMANAVSQSIDSMLEFLCAIVHPDGEIPLFADSGFHESPSTAELFDSCELLGCTLGEGAGSTIGGYEVFRQDGLFAICDFGDIAAKNLPAHGHCDATNLVVSVKGSRWIVDSGNFNYENDPMRHYCRSSIGHNVVTVENANQANVWSKFRMGRRPSLFDRKRGLDDGWNWASVSHDGYAFVGVKRLTRIVACHKSVLVCLDRATGGDKTLVGYLHFHPSLAVAAVSVCGDYHALKLACGGVEQIMTLSCDRVEILEGWHCPEFGLRQSGPVVRYSTEIPSRILGWVLHEVGNNPNFEFNHFDGRITMTGRPKFLFRW